MFGRDPAEVAAAGGEALARMAAACEKGAGHEEFIPVKRLSKAAAAYSRAAAHVHSPSACQGAVEGRLPGDEDRGI